MNTPIQADEQAAVASAPTFNANRQAELLNPIIGDDEELTLLQAAYAIEFLSRLHEIAADCAQRAEENRFGIESEFNSNELRGLSMLTKCISAALHFEVKGRI